MRVAAVDGFLLDAPENDAMRAAFGGQGPLAQKVCGFPLRAGLLLVRVLPSGGSSGGG